MLQKSPRSSARGFLQKYDPSPKYSGGIYAVVGKKLTGYLTDVQKKKASSHT